MPEVITPGGRVGNDDKLGSRTNGENWIERTKPGGNGSLPPYMRTVRNGMMKQGKTEEEATRLAIAAVERWARGGGNVSPKVRAAAVKDVAEWEAMRGIAHAGHLAKDTADAAKETDKKEYAMTLETKRAFTDAHKKKLAESGHAFVNSNGVPSYPIEDEHDLENAGKDFNAGRYIPADKTELHEYIERRAKQLGEPCPVCSSGTKSDDDELEHKAVTVNGVKTLISADDNTGIVEAFVSVTGVRDNVGDIIEPGAYTKTLKDRIPKGIDGHDWLKPTSKALEIKELLPGDPQLPATIKNADGSFSPWPEGAGALYVKAQFNLNTQRGRDAYEDVKFYGDDQEWSIGYNVPAGGATLSNKGGVRTRHIKTLDLYEYSHVLWGAMPLSRSKSVKDAQQTHLELKSAFGSDYYVTHGIDEIEAYLAEQKSYFGFETKDTNGKQCKICKGAATEALTAGGVTEYSCSRHVAMVKNLLKRKTGSTDITEHSIESKGLDPAGPYYDADQQAETWLEGNDVDDDVDWNSGPIPGDATTDEDDTGIVFEFPQEDVHETSLEIGQAAARGRVTPGELKVLEAAQEIMDRLAEPETKMLTEITDDLEGEVPEDVWDTVSNLAAQFDEAYENDNATRMERVATSIRNFIDGQSDDPDVQAVLSKLQSQMDSVLDDVDPYEDSSGTDGGDGDPTAVKVFEVPDGFTAKDLLMQGVETKSLTGLFGI